MAWLVSAARRGTAGRAFPGGDLDAGDLAWWRTIRRLGVRGRSAACAARAGSPRRHPARGRRRACPTPRRPGGNAPYAVSDPRTLSVRNRPGYWDLRRGGWGGRSSGAGLGRGRLVLLGDHDRSLDQDQELAV